MSTITEQNWQLLKEVRAELGLDKAPEPDHAEESRREPKTFTKRSKDGSLVTYYKPREKTPQTNPFPPRPGELVASEWINMEAKRSGYAPAYVRQKLWLGDYDERIIKRQIHTRLVYIKDKKKGLK